MEGLAPGDAQASVTGRNVVATLNVHVPSPAASSLGRDVALRSQTRPSGLLDLVIQPRAVLGH